MTPVDGETVSSGDGIYARARYVRHLRPHTVTRQMRDDVRALRFRGYVARRYVTGRYVAGY
jgi:hypothetical protein